ncbi:UPF0223 family protein [Alkalibacillus aidingensis]|uniref:UPF0223 family protein n=1 Tax=Alkalibacillus aidingensis TaxID=2747607 RepID=UPI001660C6CA|nr:UPF0223 family protein [Alkalibacillus aidingensis]
MNYHYPIDPDWSTEEVMDVIHFFHIVEQAYENEVARDDVLDAYHAFKRVIPAKNEEKSLFKDFEKQSGYVPYQVVKRAKESDEGSLVSLS